MLSLTISGWANLLVSTVMGMISEILWRKFVCTPWSNLDWLSKPKHYIFVSVVEVVVCDDGWCEVVGCLDDDVLIS